MFIIRKSTVINTVVYTLMVILVLLVTFFGLGPVLLADGSMQERLLTLLVVLVCYAVLVVLFILWRKRKRG